MSEVNLQDLMSLSVGDLVEAPSLFGPGSEPSLFQVSSVAPGSVSFFVTAFGVALCKASLEYINGEFSWTYKPV